jgi:hypothetical protein
LVRSKNFPLNAWLDRGAGIPARNGGLKSRATKNNVGGFKMKRMSGVLLALVLLAFAATPAFAQGARPDDHVCFGGMTVVRADANVDNVVLFGCGARISSGAQVQGDVVSFGGDVVIEPEVAVTGNVVLFGGDLDVAGRIGEDIVMFGGNTTIQSTAVVDGAVAALGGNVDRKEGAVVRGSISRGRSNGTITPPTPPRAPVVRLPNRSWFDVATGFVFDLARGVLVAIALAALGALTVAIWPQQIDQVNATAQAAALPSLGVGCLTQVVGATLILLLTIIICGIPIALIIALALTLAWLVGWIALGRLAGDKVLRALKRQEIVPVIAVVVGIILLALIGVVPVIGWFIALLVSTLGIGAVVLTRFGTRAYPTQSLAPVPVAPSVPTPPANEPKTES